MISEFIRERRKTLRKSQDALAYEAGVSRSLLQGLESGRTADMKVSTAVKLAKPLSTDAMEILRLCLVSKGAFGSASNTSS